MAGWLWPFAFGPLVFLVFRHFSEKDVVFLRNRSMEKGGPKENMFISVFGPLFDEKSHPQCNLS